MKNGFLEAIKQNKVVTALVAMSLLALIVIGFGLITGKIWVSKPKPHPVQFVHMIKANVVTIGQPAREGTVFMLPNGKNFCVPADGTRKESFLVPDKELDTNYFLVVKKVSPRIFTQGQDFQDSYNYTEIHYKVAHTESQSQPYPTINCSNN